jgi:hypothetical protein
MGNGASNPIQQLINQYNRLVDYRNSLNRQLNNVRQTNGDLTRDDNNITYHYKNTMSYYDRTIRSKQNQERIVKGDHDRYVNELYQDGVRASSGNDHLNANYERAVPLIATTAGYKMESRIYKSLLYDSLSKQNHSINDEYTRIEDGNLKYIKKSDFQTESMSLLSVVYQILYYTFYLLVAFYIYLLFVSTTSTSIYYKLFIVLVIVLFPFYINIITALLYSVWKYTYSLVTGTVNNKLSESKRAVIEKTTDLRVDGPTPLIQKHY